MTLPLASPSEVRLCPKRLARLVDRLQEDVSARQLPGAVALISRRGKVDLFEALGWQDPALGTPMARDSIFRIYSMTKPIVSLGAMMLVEQGRLLLADPVAKFLPEFAKMQVAQVKDSRIELRPAHQPITVQDLLRHTAGMGYEYAGDSYVQRLYREQRLHQRVPGRTLAQFMSTLASLPLMDEPGTVGEYSYATDVLGYLIQTISGQSLGSYLEQHVFEPLGMLDTAFHVPPDEQRRLTQSFGIDPQDGQPIKLVDVTQPPPMESGGGGLASTTMDYARFLQCLLNKGELDGRRLLGPRTVDFMTSDHLGAIPGRDSLLEAGEGFGLGFAVRLQRGVTPVTGSPGMYYWSGMAGTTFFVDPSEDMFAILMIQAPNQRGHYRQLFRTMVYASLTD